MEDTSQEVHHMMDPGNYDLDGQNMRDDLVEMDQDQIFGLMEAYRMEIVAVGDIDAAVARDDLGLHVAGFDDESLAKEILVTGEQVLNLAETVRYQLDLACACSILRLAMNSDTDTWKRRQGLYVRRKATENIHMVLRSRTSMNLHPECFIIENCDCDCESWLTPRIAGSSGILGGSAFFPSFGASSMRRSFTSLPRKTMYS